MPLLFDRRNPDDKYPTPKNWFDPSEGIALTEDSWRYWIAIEDGIPFHTVMIGGTSGMPGTQSYSNRVGGQTRSPSRIANGPWRPFRCCREG
ncbi:MAG: hypothetical protein AAF802_28785 [Planctomycetota bacterium]